MHKRIIKMSIILALCVCAFNVRGVYAQDLKVGTHIEHEYEISVVRRATEHTDGERLYKCKICGESHVETIEATGHIWSDWIVDVNPTETTEGHRYRICTKYPEHPHYQEEVIPALSASPKPFAAVKATVPSVKKDAGKLSTDKNSTSSETEDNTQENQETEDFGKDSSIAKSKVSFLEQGELKDSKTFMEHPGIKAPNVVSDAVLPLYAGVNALDVCAGVGAIAISWWYVYVLKPMVAALMWIKRKRSEIEKKLYLNK